MAPLVSPELSGVPSLHLTVWVWSPVFVHVTVESTATERFGGAKAKSTIETAPARATGCRAEGASVAAGEAAPPEQAATVIPRTMPRPTFRSVRTSPISLA